MDRRSFIGNVLGLFVSSNLPFLAEEPIYKDIFTELDRMKAIIKMVDSDELMVRNGYRIFAITRDGHRFWALGIKSVHQEKIHCVKIVLVADEICFSQALILCGMGVVDPKGNLIKTQSFSSDVCVVSGDSMHLTYTLTAGF